MKHNGSQTCLSLLGRAFVKTLTQRLSKYIGGTALILKIHSVYSSLNKVTTHKHRGSKCYREFVTLGILKVQMREHT